VLFKAKRHVAAQRVYEQVMRDAPDLAEPVKRAGNCSYAAGQPGIAEVYFRKAVELDPLDAQAHHFLADAYLAQGKRADAQAATMAAIAANPAYYPAWRVLRTIYAAKSRPIRTLRIRPGAGVAPGSNGQPKITVWKHLCAGPQDEATWVAYATAKSGLEAKGDPFTAELRGYRSALECHKDATHLSLEERASPALFLMDKLQQFEARGELEVALLLLCFNEAYRRELEAVKRERPDAFTTFVERYAVAPI
jgi:tetratricopeptide (TPR) repeat protein